MTNATDSTKRHDFLVISSTAPRVYRESFWCSGPGETRAEAQAHLEASRPEWTVLPVEGIRWTPVR